ncbi:hypothetical protein PUN28_018536 [Cardiocondyla obscurior]|uniref:Exonuclease domain-containing protein n=1 Tax=Cardiocondyla obscurior TaxID=286306 RepID=A0AAW2EGD5_9HYME
MEIQTFVFLDLETTGLIEKSSMPKITEVALVAVSRESICKGFPPRILHKLVVPINPNRIIPPNVEQITKLYNEDVQQLQPFENELYMLIMYFLQRLTPPICFAAHNGDKFDFPIFLAELEHLDKFLDDKILCIDTWKMFRDFYSQPRNDPGSSKEPEIVPDLLNDEYNDVLSTLDIDATTKEKKLRVVATTSAISPCNNKCIEVTNNEKIEYDNEVEILSSKNSMQETNEKTPEKQIIKLDNIFAKRPIKKYNGKRKLNYVNNKPPNFKLETIYQSMFNSDIKDKHSAEGDCVAMIQCITEIADFFLNWSSNRAVPLSCCRKM